MKKDRPRRDGHSAARVRGSRGASLARGKESSSAGDGSSRTTGKAPSRTAAGAPSTAKRKRGQSAPKLSGGAKSSRGKASGQPARKRSPVKASPSRRAKVPPARTSTGAVNANGQAAGEIHDRLARQFPDAHCALDHRNAYELLVATILSAQCTDKRVNMVTPMLFERWPDADALSAARPEELEEAIRSTGFFRSKTKSLLGMANAVVERHHGRVPDEMDALVHLPGVGRKTANVVLGNAFDRNEGVVVDTHVTRVSQRLGLTKNADPVKIEQDLMALFPRERWTMLSHLFIEHGRQICDARKPKCESCPLSDMCPASRV